MHTVAIQVLWEIRAPPIHHASSTGFAQSQVRAYTVCSGFIGGICICAITSEFRPPRMHTLHYTRSLGALYPACHKGHLGVVKCLVDFVRSRPGWHTKEGDLHYAPFFVLGCF